MAEAIEPFSMIIHAIGHDLERTPEGNGGEVYYFPATPGHGNMGHNGDYLLKEWREVTAALAGERYRADQAEARLALVPHDPACHSNIGRACTCPWGPETTA